MPHRTIAFAYIGPGAGLEFVGYFLSLVGWGAAVFSAVLLYPVYALLRRIRGAREKLTAAPALESLPEGAGGGNPATA
jgi:hypothetical protein